MKFTDSHCHLDDIAFNEKITGIIETVSTTQYSSHHYT